MKPAEGGWMCMCSQNYHGLCHGNTAGLLPGLSQESFGYQREKLVQQRLPGLLKPLQRSCSAVSREGESFENSLSLKVPK